MKKTRIGITGFALFSMLQIASADISFLTGAPFGLFVDSLASLLPAGSSFQVIYSAGDPGSEGTAANTGDGNDISISDATATAGDTLSNGDIVLVSGTTEINGGWQNRPSSGGITSANVGGNDPNAGFLYGIVYNDGGDGVVEQGDFLALGQIVDTSTFADSSGDPPPPEDSYNFSGASLVMNVNPLDSGSHMVVPEPGTFALFALGLATIAWRRKKR